VGTTNQTKNPHHFVGCREPKQNNFFTDNTNTGTSDMIVLWAEKGLEMLADMKFLMTCSG